MSIRNLEYLFRPETVAIIGANPRPGSVGSVLTQNLLGAHFGGRVLLVNPKAESVFGHPCYPSVSALPYAPDLGLIATPPDQVPAVVAQLAEKGAKAAVVLTAGFAEGDRTDGKALQAAMLAAARPHLLRIVGPNCLGLLHPRNGLNASFAPAQPSKGSLAFVAQSGAVIASVIDWAMSRAVGFSHLVSLGDMADVDFGDMLDYLARDADTSAILLYIEMVTQPRKFMSAARAAARLKPVVVVKAGRHAEGAKAAASHTGALAGSDLVYDAAFRRAGMLRVFDLADLFSAAETLAHLRDIGRGDRLTILTNGGGIGVLATDRLIEEGGHLADLSPNTLSKLDACLPPTWSRGNPIDIIGDADGARYAAALACLDDDPGTDAILVLNCPTAVASSSDAARAVVTAASSLGHRPVLTSWVGGVAAAEGRKLLTASGLATYDTPEDAVHGFMQLVRYRRNQASLMEVPSAAPAGAPPSILPARAIIDAALADRRDWLTLPESLELLDLYGIPTVASRTAANPRQAAEAAREIPPPYALKILSPDILHKSEFGGVALDLRTPDDVESAATEMAARITQAHPETRLTGFVVQSMVRRPRAHELIIGLMEDEQFGPTILFGHGGTATEVIGDRALALPPLNLHLARELIERTRIYRLLKGYRDRPPADLEKIAFVLTRIGQLACDLAEVVELDINPLLADENGVLALDARIRVAATTRSAEARLAIRPYPQGLARSLSLSNGSAIELRPIRPEDAPACLDAFDASNLRALRLPGFAALKARPQDLSARLTQIDYEREMTLAIFAKPPNDASASRPLFGLIYLASPPELDRADFFMLLSDRADKAELARLLMESAVGYARQRAMKALSGEIEESVSAEALRPFASARVAEVADGFRRATLILD